MYPFKVQHYMETFQKVETIMEILGLSNVS